MSGETEQQEAPTADEIDRMLDGIEWQVKTDKGRPIPGVRNSRLFVETLLLKSKIRINEYTGLMEVDGKSLVTDSLVDEWRDRVEAVSNVGKWNEKDFDAALRIIASKAKRYHPIREYLKGCEKEWDGQDRIRKLIGSIIPTRDQKDIYSRYLEVFMFGAVCRIMKPGCKFDQSLILLGKEGIRKSSLFSFLVPVREWFIDTMPPLGDKDAMMAIQTAWVIEWAELESIRKANSTAIKSFLTSQFDTYRAPYGRKIEKHPRKCVFAGTTNEEEFLTSTSGNRRFMVLPLNGMIDTDYIMECRNQLWGEAIHKCRAANFDGSILLKLTADESEEQRESNLEFSPKNEWEGPVLEWLTNDKLKDIAGEKYVTTDIILDGLKIPIERRAQAQKMVGNVLRDSGWQNARRRLYAGAGQSRVFLCPENWQSEVLTRLSASAPEFFK